jgi:hypothetical protein
MPLTPSNLYMNWVNVQISYGSGPTVLALAEILDVQPDISTQQAMFYGDNNHFPVLIRNTTKARSLTIVGGDCFKALGIPEDSICTITATLLDAKNQVGTAGSGSITLVLSNAVREKAGIDGKNNQFGTLAVTFNSFAVGDADPMSITQA